MIGTEFNRLGKRLFDSDMPLKEPISLVPEVDNPGPRIINITDFFSPTIGSDGANALNGYSVAEQRIRTKYGCPDMPNRVNYKLERRMRAIDLRARSYIARRFGEHYASQSDPEYVAAIDAFEPDMDGQIDAFYSPINKGIATDTTTMHGTPRNRRAIAFYESLGNKASKLKSNFGKMLVNFYKGVARKYRDKNYAVKTMVHERGHPIIEKSVEKTPADYLSVPQNEGLNCALADETVGESTTTKGSTYDAFKRAAYRALHRIGYRSATKYVKDCDIGKTSGRRYIRNFRMAA